MPPTKPKKPEAAKESSSGSPYVKKGTLDRSLNFELRRNAGGGMAIHRKRSLGVEKNRALLAEKKSTFGIEKKRSLGVSDIKRPLGRAAPSPSTPMTQIERARRCSAMRAAAHES